MDRAVSICILLACGAISHLVKSQFQDNQTCSELFIPQVNFTFEPPMTANHSVDGVPCWSARTLDDLQLQVTCQYNVSNITGLMELIIADGFSNNPQTLYSGLLGKPCLPVFFFSPTNTIAVGTRGSNALSCKVKAVPSMTESLCGSPYVNVTDDFMIELSVLSPGSYVHTCVWLITSRPGLITAVNLTRMSWALGQHISIGKGHNSSDSLSLVFEVKQRHHVTLIFVRANELWIEFSSQMFYGCSDSETIVLFAQNYTGWKAECDEYHLLCAPDLKCLSPEAVCDGSFDCSNYFDEIGCDICGTTDVSLKRGEVFAINESVFSHYNTPAGSGCIWTLREQNGTRIKLLITEFIGNFFVLRVIDGFDVADGILLVEKYTSPLPTNVDPFLLFSLESRVTIVLQSIRDESFLMKLVIFVSTYDIIECGEGEYACNAGLGCLENTSQVCDGVKDCHFHEDELGCGSCGDRLKFQCDSNKCLTSEKICDARFDCDDYTDELGCDVCGNQNVFLSRNESLTILANTDSSGTFFADYPGTSGSIPNSTTLHHVYVNPYTGLALVNCIWTLHVPDGTKIKLEVFYIRGGYMLLSVFDGNHPANGAPVLVKESSVFFSEVPVSVLSRESQMTIVLENLTEYAFFYAMRVVLTLYETVDCKEGEYTCSFGVECLETTSQIRCDGVRDCTFSEDEFGCGGCNSMNFSCTSGECIRQIQICDGHFDCADYTDEMMCDTCGSTEIWLTVDAPITIRFYQQSYNRGYVVGVFPTNSPSWVIIPPGSNFTVYEDIVKDLSCVWILTGSNGTRFHVRVTAVDAIDIRLIMINGHDLGNASQAVFADSDSSPGRSPFVFSIDSRMAIVAKSKTASSFFERFEIEIAAVHIQECSRSEYACASGLACLDSNRKACDGFMDCPYGEDELGCDYCGSPDISLGSTPVNLTSPGYPRGYPNSISCIWEIRAPDWASVVLYVQDLVVEESYDHVYFIGTLRDGPNASFMFSGTTLIKSIAFTSSKTISVGFTTGYDVSRKGFLLQLQGTNDTTSCEGDFDCRDGTCVTREARCNGLPDCQFIPGHPPADEKDCGACGGTNILVESDPINFTLTGYPTGYPPSLDCKWLIVAQDFVSIIHVEIVDFSTEGGKDLAVLHGINLYGDTVSFELTGSIDKLISITFNSSREVSFNFRSDAYINGRGFRLELYSSNGTDTKPCHDPGVFDCGDGSCLKERGRCDGFRDCQISGADEAGCGNVSCPGSFPCQHTQECIHVSSVCDGRFDCLYEEDETPQACADRCPTKCSCDASDDGYVVECISGWSQETVGHIVVKTVHLKLANANISQLTTGVFKRFSFLKSLQLTNNSLSTFEIGTFSGLYDLTFLDISKNHFVYFQSGIFEDLLNLRKLLVIDVPLQQLESGAFKSLRNLTDLFLIRDATPYDRVLDIQAGTLEDLHSLEKLYVDDYRLCCRFDKEVPSKAFDYSKCTTTELQPPLNICGSLMRNDPLRASLWILGLSALIGNFLVIIWRCRRGKELRENETHSFLVLNLAISDLMMGVYMLIIAITDIVSGKNYSTIAKQWRSSVLCKVAGVVSVMSSEASVFFVTVISLDCFLSIVFPFSRVTIRGKLTKVIVFVIWLVAACISIIPTIFSGDNDSDVYGLSDVCIGLPLTTKVSSYTTVKNSFSSAFGSGSIAIPVPETKEPAWIYSIVLFLGVNLLCFIIVLSCYVAIFVKVKRSSKLVKVTAHRQREVKMAVKMALIVGTDFACWMPVIIMGILSQAGIVEIGPDMYAWTVVFILPINSSLNPYLYTFYSKITAQSNTKKSEPKIEMKKHKSTDTLETHISECNQPSNNSITSQKK